MKDPYAVPESKIEDLGSKQPPVSKLGTAFFIGLITPAAVSISFALILLPNQAINWFAPIVWLIGIISGMLSLLFTYKLKRIHWLAVVVSGITIGFLTLMLAAFWIQLVSF
jgi:phosphatidylserine synthase